MFDLLQKYLQSVGLDHPQMAALLHVAFVSAGEERQDRQLRMICFRVATACVAMYQNLQAKNGRPRSTHPAEQVSQLFLRIIKKENEH